MDLVLSYVPARLKRTRILPTIIQYIPPSGQNLSLLALHRTESAILVKKNEDKKTLIPLREIFRIDIMKCLFKNKSSQGLPNKKCKHKETACYITSTKKVKQAKQLL